MFSSIDWNENLFWLSETSIGYLGLRSSLTILGQMIRECKAKVVDCIHALDNQHCSIHSVMKLKKTKFMQ